MRGSKSSKILFLGDTSGPSTSVHYYNNLVRLGHTVYPFNPDPFKPRSLVDRVEMRVTRQPPARNVAEASREIVRLCARNQFEMVFSMAQNFVSAETLTEIRRVSKVPPVLIYHSHDNNFTPGVLTPPDFAEVIRAYDFVFTTKSQSVERYRALGQPRAFFILSAYEPGVHHPIPQNYSRFHPEQFPVSFVGTYDKSREPLLNSVGWRHLHIWGGHWKKFPKFEHYASRIVPNAVYHFEYSDILSHSQMVLGLLREEANDLHTQRTFEIPACGAVQVAPRNDEIKSIFKEDKEIILFSTPAELEAKVSHYLARDEKRREIGRRGYERVTKGKHTYLDRVMEILKITKSSKVYVGTKRTSAKIAKAA